MKRFWRFWRYWSKRFARLQPRSQWLIVVAALGTVFAVSDLLLMSPAKQRLLRAMGEQELIRVPLLAAKAENLSLNAQLSQDPNAPLRAQLATVQSKLEAQNQHIEELTSNLVAREQMASALRRVLAQRPGLELLALKNLPAERAFAPNLKTLSGEALDLDQPLIYKHGLIITVRGEYFLLLSYIRDLESLPWRLHWQALDYQVTGYPQAELTLTVFTLSYQENWIGA